MNKKFKVLLTMVSSVTLTILPFSVVSCKKNIDKEKEDLKKQLIEKTDQLLEALTREFDMMKANKKDMDAKSTEIENLNTQINDIKAERDRKEQEIFKLKEAKQFAEQEKREIEDKLSHFAEMESILRLKIIDLEQKSQKDKEHYESSIASLKTQLKNAETQKANSQQAIEQIKKAKTDLENRVKELEEKYQNSAEVIENAKLKKEVLKLQNLLKEQKELIKSQMNKYENNISNLSEKNKQNEALLDFQKQNLKSLKSKYLKRAPSVIEAIRLVQSLNHYILDSISTKYKDRYESNKKLINNQMNLLKTNLKDINNIELSYDNSNMLYNNLIEAMNFSNLIQELIIPDDESVTDIEIPFKKAEFIDVLFDWRIADLTKLQEALKAQETNETYKTTTIKLYKAMDDKSLKELAAKMQITNYESKSHDELAKLVFEKNKQMQAETVAEIKETYELAKTQDKNLTSQIMHYIHLEQKVWFQNIQDPSTTDKFHPSYGVDFQVSLFPLLNQIIDKEVLKEFDDIIHKIQDDYSTFYKKNVTYLNSIKYEKFYNYYIDAQRYDLIPDIYTRKGITAYLKLLKTELSNFEIDVEKEKAELTERINSLKTKTNILFNSKIRNKRSELIEDGKEETPLGKTYQELYVYFNKAKNRAGQSLGQYATVADLFDKVLEYEKLNDELNSAVFLLEYFKGLGISPSDEKMSKYLNLEALSAKFIKNAKQAQTQVDELQASVNKIDELRDIFDSIKIEKPTVENAKEQNDSNITTLEKFITEIKSQKNFIPGLESDGKFYFGYYELPENEKYKYNEAIDNAVVKAEELLKQMQELKDNAEEIVKKYDSFKEEYNAIKNDIFGAPKAPNNYDPNCLYDVINEDLESAQGYVRSFNKKAKEAQKSAFIIPLNEVVVLLRQGDIINSQFYNEHSVSDTHPDKYAYQVTTDALKQLREKNPLFRDITNASSKSISALDEKDTTFNANEVYTELLKIEKNYYEVNVEYMDAKLKNANNLAEIKTKLEKARDKYYEFLRNPKIQFDNELNPKVTSYKFASEDTGASSPSLLNPANLILDFAQAHSSKTLMQLISDEKVK
ncbi:hypothetical protein [Mycoplasma seminis]|uniref:Lipoprotein n=1 Tax=Mycoplasma seminis TaxID=512749 RepID=A0ABY9H9J4_9MOLU|nr:hypothetical protein [Mycoplasma seminis]WLP85197.1 hypothetical protein Q8852_02645 [Mycoplasma seminis]